MSRIRQRALIDNFVLLGVGAGWPGYVWAEDPPIEAQVVDALNKAFGAHPGYRANHAKGIVVEGSFKASFSAPKLSRFFSKAPESSESLLERSANP